GTTPQPTAAAAAVPAEATGEQPAAVMEADEAAPLRAPAISGNNLDDLMDPPSPEVAPTLISARTELRAGRPKEAEALLRPLFEKYPDDYHVAEAMAQALLARGAAVEAVGFAQRVVKKQPKRASYRVLLGDALRRAGDEPSAKLAYKDALALDPKLREAQRRLKNRKLTGTP
ncbi:MAG TPA: tetratricopeptide repeat protein, partial [Polyangiales bacterium]|nr:tetratricopeptide repeat protein [Polyangiales bacterium]